MSITPVYAALLALLFTALSTRAILTRRRLQVAVGDGGHPELLRAMRVQANFAEYTPITLLLIVLVELQGGAAVMLHLLGILLLVGRLLHAWGVSQTREDFRFRIVGMTMTVLALLFAALTALYLGL